MKIKWTIEKLQEEAIKYNHRSEFQKHSHSAYQTAHARGLLDEICSHMVPLHNKWTDEMIAEEALKYTTRTEFKNNSLAYHTAVKRNLLEKICTHMPETISQPYTYDELKAESLKYETRGDFQNNSPAYTAVLRRGLLNELTSHMSMVATISAAEITLLHKIKEIFPKAQKFRDKKVRIESKPYVCGFDIDIYIPEVRKGIEFDGDYHHSFKGLKRGRPNWPDEDIHNYHQLKDSHFASKGIQILHIKEEDWLKDKESCIKRCLEFLSSK